MRAIERRVIRSPLIWAALLLLLGCAARPGRPGAPAEGAAQAESLPRHLTVELHQDGSLELDGRATSLERLQSEITSAWQTNQFEHVLLWADSGTLQPSAQRVLDVFLRAGINQWRFAWRAKDIVPPVTAAPASSASAQEQAPPASAASSPAPPSSEPKVNLKTIGLHLGGGPKDEATRQTLVQLFEAKFPAFHQCAEQLSPMPTRLTSFGIDLYVTVQGGKAQARDVRTSLQPEAFRVCMKAAFTSIEFPAPEKPLVISYSVAFSPISGG